MNVAKEKFIDAGISYIYQLDGYNRSSVRDQIAIEFDEIINLNQQEILEQRSKYFSVGEGRDF